MIKWSYRSDGWRPDPATLGRIIDIGGANSFAHGYLDAVIDIRPPQASARKTFVGNIDFSGVWDEVYNHITEFQEWDYAICTHTLEDIINSVFACNWIQQIAKRGLIVVPSKYRELSRFQSPHYRGFMHHHWIFDVVDGQFTAFPKFNLIEDPYFDKIKGHHFYEELVIEWEHTIDLKMINNGMPYGTDKLSGEEHMMQLYKQLI